MIETMEYKGAIVPVKVLVNTLLAENEYLARELTTLRALEAAARTCTDMWCHPDCPCAIHQALTALDLLRAKEGGK